MSKKLNRQSGFTLVELAVVMIIIGLLIGGVLKGQELIGNAQVTSTISQIKAVDAATSTFRDMYNALPGDIQNPGTRLPNCTSAGCAISSPVAGDNRLDSNPSQAPGTEASAYFIHLAAADLITGIDESRTAGVWGGFFPGTPIRGTGIHVASSTAATQLGVATAEQTGAMSGLYITLTGTPNTGPTDAITPNQAFRIDNKLDDGLPGAGSVRGGGSACVSGTAYAEATSDPVCFIQVRIQG